MIKHSDYALLVRLLHDCSPGQLVDAEDEVRSIREAQPGLSAIANHARNRDADRVCPRCGFEGAHRHGLDARGGQRFRCVKAKGGCGRTFNGLTETPFARMRKPERWSAFLQAMAAGHRSIDDLHRHGGVGVSRATLFRWRTVILKALSDPDPTPLGGVIEADETYFRESFKGSRDWKRGKPPAPRPPRRRGKAGRRGLSWEQVPVVTAVDRDGRKLKRVVGYRDDVPDALLDGIQLDSVLCTDGFAGYRRVARESQSLHKVIASPLRRRKADGAARPAPDPDGGTFSLARVNALHQQLKTFVNHEAKGVSTRHLQGYLNWIDAVREPSLSRCRVLLDARDSLRVGSSWAPPRRE